jgi:hypothetical protein
MPPARCRRSAWVCALVVALVCATRGFAQPSPKCGFLFIVETSAGMAKLSEPAQQTLASLITSGLQGEMRNGEEVAVWTYNDQINARGLSVLAWSPESGPAVALRAVAHLRTQKFRRASRMDRLVPEMLEAMRATELLVAIIISDGAEVIVGTPFDRHINVTFGSRAAEMRGAKKPFVTVLAARRGVIVDHAVVLGDEMFALPNFRPALVTAGEPGTALQGFTPPASVPVLVKPGAASVPATNGLVRPPAVVAKSPPPPPPPTVASGAQQKQPEAMRQPEPQPPSPAGGQSTLSPKREEPREPATPKATPSAPAVSPASTATNTNSPAPVAPPATPRDAAVAPLPPPAASPRRTAPTATPVLITNRPPPAPLAVTGASKGDFLGGGRPPPPVTQSPPSPAAPSQPKSAQPVAAPSTNSPPAPPPSGPPVQPVAVAPKPVTNEPPQVSASPTAAPPETRKAAPVEVRQPPPLQSGQQLAVAAPAAARWRTPVLLGVALLLAIAGFWILRPWLRQLEPTAPTSLISRSMDDERDRK